MESLSKMNAYRVKELSSGEWVNSASLKWVAAENGVRREFEYTTTPLASDCILFTKGESELMFDNPVMFSIFCA